MDTVHRRIVFLALLLGILISVWARKESHARVVVVEGVATATTTASTNPVPQWMKTAYMSGSSCPAIVSQCLLPDMISDLNSKIQHQQNLIKEYTKEIVDIENRYPITFQIDRVDISNVYLDATSALQRRPTFASWVSGTLPYPQLSFTFPTSPPGPPGGKGPVGAAGLAAAATMLPVGEQGPPGYVGVAKE